MIENKYGVEVGIEGNIGVRTRASVLLWDDVITLLKLMHLIIPQHNSKQFNQNSKLLHCLCRNLNTIQI